jgi:hypothetical protein
MELWSLVRRVAKNEDGASFIEYTALAWHHACRGCRRDDEPLLPLRWWCPLRFPEATRFKTTVVSIIRNLNRKEYTVPQSN